MSYFQIYCCSVAAMLLTGGLFAQYTLGGVRYVHLPSLVLISLLPFANIVIAAWLAFCVLVVGLRVVQGQAHP